MKGEGGKGKGVGRKTRIACSLLEIGHKKLFF